MRKILLSLLFLLFVAVSSYGRDISDIEKAAIQRAENDPATAYEYFLEQIETGASIEKQAIYLYGMGLALEKQGDTREAINDYLAAEALGNQSARRALRRLQNQLNREG